MVKLNLHAPYSDLTVFSYTNSVVYLLFLPGIEQRFFGCPARSSVSVPTKLSWVHQENIFSACHIVG